MKAMLWAVCLLTFTSLIDGQEQTRPPTPAISPGRQITSGAVENGRYTNAFFRFSILIPAGWESMTEEEYAERKRRLQKFASKQNSRTKEELIAGPSSIPIILRLTPQNDLKGEARTFTILAQDLSG